MHSRCFKVVFQLYFIATRGFCETFEEQRPLQGSFTSSDHPSVLFNAIPPSSFSQTPPTIPMDRRRVGVRTSRHHVARKPYRVAQQRSITVLGRPYSTWTVAFLRACLRHYGQSPAHATSKRRLLQLMDMLARDHNLDGTDYEEMYAAYWARQAFPPRKPPLAAISGPSTTSHPTTVSSQDASRETAPLRPRTTRPVPSLPSVTPSPRRILRPQATLRPASLLGPVQHSQRKDLPDDESRTQRASRGSQPRSGKTCIVCWDDLGSEIISQGPITSKCTHERNVCNACISQTISSQLDSKMWDQITCPACEEIMEYPSIQKFAKATILARYVAPTFCLFCQLTMF